MDRMWKSLTLLILPLLWSCGETAGTTGEQLISDDTSTAYYLKDSTEMADYRARIAVDTSPVIRFFEGKEIDTHGVPAHDVTSYAKTLIGIPYKYASTDPAAGFDCSGFITYVFSHFNILVPRSSIDFTEVGTEIPEAEAREGDLVLFTGTDSSEHFVGHMGLVLGRENGVMQFIHSSSGKANGVTITPLNDYYRGRYIKTIRVFK